MSKPVFSNLYSIAIPLDRRNVDTDQIIPARFLRKPRAAGMAAYLFHDLRLDADGDARPEFVFNAPIYQHASVLVARENFGSGSSREAAVYALWDGGIRVVIAPSFGDIFYSNSLKNGLLPVVLDSARVDQWLQRLLAEPGLRVRVDLEHQTVALGDDAADRFEICPFQKLLLLTGQDELGYTLALDAKVKAFEAARAATEPWL
ncbi:MAG: 3-isopropylmalate dehydratase small subunit [Betaproteobacteria bacterium]|nr:3-isopropylmalate dehydratase small subunit [Betaproteobacteria bacterium]